MIGFTSDTGRWHHTGGQNDTHFRTLMQRIKHRCLFICAVPKNSGMWSDIIHEFADSPSQSRVVRFLLENGFGVTADGRINCNGIEMSATAVAKAIGSDRRVVDSTAKRILERPYLSKIFLNMRATPDLSMVAATLGYTVITVLPKNANERGIVGAAVRVLFENDLSIRQIFVTDPQLSEEPRLVIIVEEPLPPGVIEKIRGLPQVKQVTI